MIGARGERIARVYAALAAAGAVYEARELSANTATAALAAAALECAQAQIAKTIVFRAEGDSGEGRAVAVVAVLCGDDRVDTKRLAALAGKKLGKADAAFVNAQCGFEIGGVAPLGFPAPLPVFLEQRLTRFSTIWAAAGSAHAVFGIAPDALPRATGGAYAEFAAAQ